MFSNFFTTVGPNLAKQINLAPTGVSVFDYLKTEMLTVCSCHQLMKMKLSGWCEAAKGLSMNIVKHIITSISELRWPSG